MTRLRYTLLGDGSSDEMLVHPIRWALKRRGVAIEDGQWADLGRARLKPDGLAAKVRWALQFYRTDLLFVHRDAEGDARNDRVAEIREAVAGSDSPHVPVVPVRMTEAWFLHREDAIRRAAGNPTGRAALRVPRPAEVESLPDPKRKLDDLLLTASGLSGRRIKKLRRELGRKRARVAELITDFEPLVDVPAFAVFLNDLDVALRDLRSGGRRPGPEGAR